MFNYVLREGRLLIQAKTGLNTSLLVCSGLALAASFALFAFLCVALYYWLSIATRDRFRLSRECRSFPFAGHNIRRLRQRNA